MLNNRPAIHILGTRGIPAQHGGFETFAHHLAIYLEEKGWDVTVYCQESGSGEIVTEFWNGIRLVKIPVSRKGPLGTMIFDWKAANIARRTTGLHLVLGYNTAIFNFILRGCRANKLFNMDGLEWKRAKWSLPAKIWFYFNEKAACFMADHLIADHPEIKNYLLKMVKDKKVTMIPYGAPLIKSISSEPLLKYNLKPGEYIILVARPEPENSILEIVTGFCAKSRNCKLVVLGDYDFNNHPYHRQIKSCVNDNVLFLGAIYDPEVLSSLRFHAMLYIHGHTVGGTNPSLVEAMGAGNAIIAHDNPFNRWVAGEKAAFFSSSSEFASKLDEIVGNEELLDSMRIGSRKRFSERFTWPLVLSEYEECLKRFL